MNEDDSKSKEVNFKKMPEKLKILKSSSEIVLVNEKDVVEFILEIE